MRDLPIYLFTGFLESGKTKFIQETLEDERFNAGEKTLLLVCEEGEEEYDISKMPYQNVFIRTIEDKSELTEKNIIKFSMKLSLVISNVFITAILIGQGGYFYEIK